VLSFFILLAVTAFSGGGDPSTWAQIATMWILIPIMIAMVIFFVLSIALIYGLAQLLNIAPYYTGRAQDFVYKVSGSIKRWTETAVKPVFFIADIEARIKRIFGIK
jgi:hypothetical protein